MKAFWVFLVSLLMIGGMSPVTGLAEPQHVFLTATEYPPYYGQTLENYGWISEIIVTAYQRVGYEVTIKFYPWKRAITMVEDGECDGLFTVWYRPEREAKMAFSTPLPPNELVFYKRKIDPIRFTTFEALKPYLIGMVRGYVYPPAFEHATYLKREEVTEDIQNLKKLVANRVDLIIIDKGMAKYLIKTMLPEAQDKLEWLEPAIEISPQYLVISKQASDYQRKLDDFNRGLAQLMQEGGLEKIRTKYGY